MRFNIKYLMLAGAALAVLMAKGEAAETKHSFRGIVEESGSKNDFANRMVAASEVKQPKFPWLRKLLGNEVKDGAPGGLLRRLTTNPFDIVFIVDESGSMGGVQAQLKANVVTLFNQLQAQAPGSRAGLVGYGASWSHSSVNSGSGPHLHTALTGDPGTFQTAANELVAAGGIEPGYWTIYESVATVAGRTNFEMGFTPNSGFCVVIFTDEDNDNVVPPAITEAQVIDVLKNDVTNEANANGVFFGVTAVSVAFSYKDIASATGGTMLILSDFVFDTSTVLNALVSGCNFALNQITLSPATANLVLGNAHSLTIGTNQLSGGVVIPLGAEPVTLTVLDGPDANLVLYSGNTDSNGVQDVTYNPLDNNSGWGGGTINCEVCLVSNLSICAPAQATWAAPIGPCSGSSAGDLCDNGNGCCDGSSDTCFPIGDPVCPCVNTEPDGDKDHGCPPTGNPDNLICVNNDGTVIGDDELGDVCARCVDSDTASGVDDGCFSAFPLCIGFLSLEDGSGLPGDACAVCVDSATGSGTDDGCTGAFPLCIGGQSAEDGSGLPGDTCAVCVDSAAGSGTDDGCTDVSPFCIGGQSAEDGSGLPGERCVECVANSDCFDNVACTDDTCVSNVCVNTANDDYCNDGNECTEDECDVVFGDPLSGCYYENLPAGSPCDDGDKCASFTGQQGTPDGCDGSGQCISNPVRDFYYWKCGKALFLCGIEKDSSIVSKFANGYKIGAEANVCNTGAVDTVVLMEYEDCWNKEPPIGGKCPPVDITLPNGKTKTKSYGLSNYGFVSCEYSDCDKFEV